MGFNSGFKGLMSYAIERLRKNVLRWLGYCGTLRCKEHVESEKSAVILSATAVSAASLCLVMLSYYIRSSYKNSVHLLQVSKEMTI